MDLAPEERQQIYAEEKARLEAQQAKAEPQDTKKAGVGCAAMALITLGAIVMIAIFGISSSSVSSGSPKRITYTVTGMGRAGLTYQNASGGTEQKTVSLPWTLELTAPSGEFLYLSAQKQQEYGTITARVYVDGTMLQQAEADSDYGIALVSGRVP